MLTRKFKLTCGAHILGHADRDKVFSQPFSFLFSLRTFETDNGPPPPTSFLKFSPFSCLLQKPSSVSFLTFSSFLELKHLEHGRQDLSRAETLKCHAVLPGMLKLTHTKGKERETVQESCCRGVIERAERQAGKGKKWEKTLKELFVLHTYLPYSLHRQFTGLLQPSEMLSSHFHLPNCPQSHLFYQSLSSSLHTPMWKNLLQFSTTKGNIF